ncbi:YopX family protein [Bacillus licheniformis]|nr:YopX family protein [Bacillus licheniformis]
MESFTDEEAPVTEYTGLKDKTDREIYEKTSLRNPI